MTAWTTTELNRAKALVSDGLSAREIGNQIGRTREGVRSVLKAHGVKLQLRGRPKDTIEDDDQRTAMKAYVASQKLLAAIQVAGLRP